MAHDPTRSWPTGKGPDDTSVPGAAWLELLDGQAFPVVGAGVMVRDGNVWAPASSSNPLHVRAQALEQLIGALNATKETNPDAASASMLALLRGLIAIVGKEATLGQILAALGAPAQESTLVDVLAALTTLAGTIDSGAQKVTLTGRNGADLQTRGKETIAFYRSGDLAANTSEVLINVVGSEVHLEALTWGTDYALSRLRITPYTASGALGTELMVPTKDGLAVQYISATSLQTYTNGENDFFRVTIYDTSANQYMVVMKRQARFGNGLQIRIQNPDVSSAHKVAVAGMVYVMRP